MDYKKILEGVVDIINTTEKSDIGFTNICTYISENCPELKESEDEKIRKSLRECFEWLRDDARWTDVYGSSFDSIFSWLEKQGEHANFRNKIQIGDKVTRNEDGVLVNLSQLNRVAKPADNVEPKFKEGDMISNGMSEVKIIEVNDNSYSVTNDEIENDCNLSNWVVYFKDQNNWELVEQNPAWSEEDVAMLNSAIAFIEHSPFTTIGKSKGGVVAWLKSLKQRYTWKPSDEQMKLLREVQQALLGKDCHNRFADFMYELKRLREELL